MQVPSLKLEAESWFVRLADITTDNVIDLLLYSEAKNCALLKEYVMDYFANNGRDVLMEVSFEDIPESRSLFTDLLFAISAKGGDEDEVSGDSGNYKLTRVSQLRRILHGLGLDTDGSREMLIERLEKYEVDEVSEDESSFDLGIVNVSASYQTEAFARRLG